MRTLGVFILIVVFGTYGWHAFNMPGFRVPGIVFMGIAVALFFGGCSFARTVNRRGYLYFDR